MKHFVGRESGRLTSTSEAASSDRDRLFRQANRLEPEVLKFGRNGIRCGKFVGAADFGWAQLEILPKLEPFGELDQARRFLYDLLAASGMVPRPFVRSGRTPADESRLLEPLRQAFAEHLYSLLVDGPPRRYHSRSERSDVLRGQVRFSDLARMLPTERFQLPIRHAPLHYNNDLARLLKSLASHLALASRSAQTNALLDRCDRLLARVDLVPLRAAIAGGVTLSRFEERWTPFVQLAEILVKGAAPSPVSAGTADGFSLLFSLHDVFERLLRRTLIGHDFQPVRLEVGPPRRRLLHPVGSGKPALSLRPDFLFKDVANGAIMVGDAKWKILDLEKRGLGLSPSDLYQINTYLAVHNSRVGVLFFPRTPKMGTGAWYRQYRLAGLDTQLTVAGVDVPGLVSRDNARRDRAVGELKKVLLVAARSGASEAAVPA